MHRIHYLVPLSQRYEVDALGGPLCGFMATKSYQCLDVWYKKADVKTYSFHETRVFRGFVQNSHGFHWDFETTRFMQEFSKVL